MTVKVRNTDMNSERQKALENAMHQITREFGAGAIMRLGDMKGKLDTEVIPTGSLALDIAVGVGGYPRGRVIEIYGPESSGKTTLALHAIAEAQKNNGVAAFIDAEHALDPVYAHHLGVDTERLLISQPDSGEQAYQPHTQSDAQHQRAVRSKIPAHGHQESHEAVKSLRSRKGRQNHITC